MIACPCPGCGRPTPLALSSHEQIRCHGCGYQGPPTREVGEQLRAASALLASLDVKERQLDATQQSAVNKALGQRSTLRLVAALASALPLAWSTLGLAFFIADKDEPSAAAVLPVILLPSAVFAALAALALRHAAERRERLLALCAAEPPASPGQPSSCHVCGAPLSTRDAEAIARCAYCSADNVVAPQAIDAARRRREALATDIESAVQREGKAASAADVLAGFGVIASLLAAPFAGFALAVAFWFAIGIFLAVAELPPYTGRYTWVQSGAERCVGRVLRDGAIDLGQPKDQTKRARVPAERALGEVQFPSLVGKRLRLPSGSEGVAKKFIRDPTEGRNRVGFEGGGSGYVDGACLVERP